MKLIGSVIVAMVITVPALAQPRAFEYTRSSVGGVQYYLINNGIFGNDPGNTSNGLMYPRGSASNYIFGSGLWFGARKQRGDSTLSLAFLTYNPSSGMSWAAPGEALPGTNLGAGLLGISTEVDQRNGESTRPNRPNWPLWRLGFLPPTFLSPGNYVRDTTARIMDARVKAPAFVPGVAEQFVSRFCDVDLTRYEYGVARAQDYGFPLSLQFQQNVYGWSTGPFESTVLLQYEVVNVGGDTLRECYVGQMTDADIGKGNNDHVSWIDADTTLQASAAWSDAESNPFGLLLITGVETPAINAEDGSIDNARRGDYSAQRGITEARLLPLAEDPVRPADLYSALAEHRHDHDMGPQDVREIHSSGPFTLRPGDTAHFAIAYTIVNASWPLSEQALSQIGATLRQLRGMYYATTELGVTRDAGAADRAAALSVTPMPATSSVEIEGALTGTMSAELRLMDQLGRDMMPARQIVVRQGHFAATIDVSTLPPGIYFVTAAGNGTITSAKVLVAR